MFSRFLVTAAFAASLVLTPAPKAQAGNNDAIAALVIGGLIGAAVLNEQRKRRERAVVNQPAPQPSQPTKKKRRPVISAAQRAENSTVQTGLNYFGYNAGTVDGVVGRKTRAAIRRYQEAMGYEVDGRLSTEERVFLEESRQRAESARYDPQYREVLAREGRDGVLRQYRDEELGIVTPAVARSANDDLQPRQPEPSTGGSLPSFDAGDASGSLNQLCNEVNILTMTNGGLVAPGSVSDGEFALKEQFCLARAHAISEGNKLMASMANEDQTAVVGQCEGLVDYMAPVMRSISVKSAKKARRDIEARVIESGQSKGQLITAGRICLGSGYRVDSAQIALASAAVLVVSGLPAYGEIISHHLREGLGGLTPDRARADDWLTATLTGLERGDTSVLGQKPDRAAILGEALSGRTVANDTSAPGSGLPVFKVTGND